jgi:Rieske Fe-S protein
MPGGSNGLSALDTRIKPADVKMNTATSHLTTKLFPGTTDLYIGVFVCRDSGGLYALDGNCTHRGCLVNFMVAQTNFSCNCHGATYDFNGGSPTGPAMGPMKHYDMSLSANGTVVVDLEKVVDAKMRYNL